MHANNTLTDKISIAIIDDHESVLHGVASYLKENLSNAKTFLFSEGKAFLRHISKRPYDLYILDLGLKDIDGIELLEEIKSIYPSAKIIIHTMREEIWIVKRLIQYDVDAIVLKSYPLDVLKKAIEQVMSGRKYYCQRLKYLQNNSSLPTHDSYLYFEKFNETDLKIIRLMAKGATSEEIARQLGYKKNTIMSYRKDLFRKFDVNSAAELVSKAIANGFISINDKD